MLEDEILYLIMIWRKYFFVFALYKNSSPKLFFVSIHLLIFLDYIMQIPVITAVPLGSVEK